MAAPSLTDKFRKVKIARCGTWMLETGSIGLGFACPSTSVRDVNQKIIGDKTYNSIICKSLTSLDDGAINFW